MTQDERRLLQTFRNLGDAQKTSLLDYADFLVARAGSAVGDAIPTEPLDIPRPAEENVVKAIRRLMTTYPMLDRSRDKLLHETSALMTQHLIHKRPAVEVIDELELVFRRHYETLNDNSSGS